MASRQKRALGEAGTSLYCERMFGKRAEQIMEGCHGEVVGARFLIEELGTEDSRLRSIGLQIKH